MQTKFLPSLLVSLLLLLGYSCNKIETIEPGPILNISRTDIEVGNDTGYTDTLVILSNIDWTINVPADASAWLSVDPSTKTTGDTTIVTIRVLAGNTAATQAATLTVTPANPNIPARQINISRKAYSLVWQKCYGGSDDDVCNGTTLLPNGQFVTTGTSYSTDGDAAGNSFYPVGWTLRSGSDGTRLWQKKIDPFDVQYRSVAASSDGGTVSLGVGAAANVYSDFFAVKFDANGNVIWNKEYGGSLAETPKSIISTPDGGYLLTGDTYSNDDFITSHGGRDIWIVKIDANGEVIWQKTYGGAGDDVYATAGTCSDGGYVILGFTASNNSGDVGANHGSQDLLVVKVDANGNKLWNKTIGGSALEIATSAIGDTDGGCIIMGYTNSKDGDVIGRTGTDNDTWVVKFSKDGDIGWQTTLGGSGVEVGTGMIRLPNGNIAISNNSNSNDRGITGNHGSLDVWVVVINNTGKILWQKTFGSSASDISTAINAGADGSILVTSNVTGNDGDVSGNHGKRDGWVFKLQ